MFSQGVLPPNSHSGSLWITALSLGSAVCSPGFPSTISPSASVGISREFHSFLDLVTLREVFSLLQNVMEATRTPGSPPRSSPAAGIPSRHGMQEPEIFLQLQTLNRESSRDLLSRPKQVDNQFLREQKEGMGGLSLEKQIPKKPWKDQGRAHQAFTGRQGAFPTRGVPYPMEAMAPCEIIPFSSQELDSSQSPWVQSINSWRVFGFSLGFSW